MKIVDLKPFERIVAKKNAEYKKFDQLRLKLPEDYAERLEVGAQLVIDAIKHRKSATSADVIKEYLYAHGFGDSEARAVLWSGVANRKFKFDANWDIKK